MKGNKMSAILAILLMLCGVFAILPLAHAQGTPTGLCAASITTPSYPPLTYTPNINYVWSPSLPGTHFSCDVWVFNITDQMPSWSVGFYYNPTVLQVVSITNGSAFDPWTSLTALYIPGSFNNTAGIANVYSWSVYSTSVPWGILAPNKWSDLLHVTFEINPALTTAEVIPIAGIPQQMMGFSTSISSPAQLLFVDQQSNDITPYGNIVNGTITLTLPPAQPPVAASVVSPNPATTGSTVTFDAATSTAGWTGVATAPIAYYYWDLLWNSTWVKTTSDTITVTFATPGTYSLMLTVNAQLGNYNMNSTNADTQTVVVVTPPSGCLITLYTQNWRYVDPNWISTTYLGDESGLLNGTEADSFRPGDLVQLFANATYNGAPVSNALVTFEVFNNQSQIVLTATAATNCYGLAEWDFRLPWPSSDGLQVNNFTQGSFAPVEYNTTAEFGEWTAYATWQLGSQFTEQKPFEKTQAAYITFDVSWGLSVSIVSILPNPAVRGAASCGYGSDVVVKVNVFNEYLEPVSGTLFCTIYDNLLVPIYPVPSITESFPVGTTSWSFASIGIPSYAFVGTGYVVVNLLSTEPSLSGTAFCPTAIGTLVINAP